MTRAVDVPWIEPGLNLVLLCVTSHTAVHSMILQSTQLYERVLAIEVVNITLIL